MKNIYLEQNYKEIKTLFLLQIKTIFVVIISLHTLFIQSTCVERQENCASSAQQLFCQIVYVDNQTRKHLAELTQLLPYANWSELHKKTCADIKDGATVMLYNDVTYTLAESIAAAAVLPEHMHIMQHLQHYQRLLNEGHAHIVNWQLDENNQLHTRNFTDERIILQLGVRSLTVEGTQIVNGLLLVNGIVKVNGRIILNGVYVTDLIATRSSTSSGGGSGTGITTIDGNTGSVTGSSVAIQGGDSISTTGAGTTLTVNVSGTTQYAVQVGDSSGGLTSITNLGTNGQTLTSTGTATQPAFQTSSASNITITGDQGLPISGTNLTFNALPEGGTTTFTADNVQTMTLNVTDSNNNTFIGISTKTGSSATDNTAIGQSALGALTSGAGNTAIGAQSLQAYTSNIGNTAAGYGAAVNLKGGNNNVFIGASAGNGMTTTTASNHTLVGYHAGYNYNGLENNNICIGSDTGGTEDQNGQLILGSTSEPATISTTYIAGIYNTALSGTSVIISSAGQLGTLTSSKRFKENITPMKKEFSENIFKLEPVTFNYKEDVNKTPTWGLIAEQVEEVFPQLVVYDKDNMPFSVKYHELPVLLLNEVKKMVEEHDILQQNVAKLVQEAEELTC